MTSRPSSEGRAAVAVVCVVATALAFMEAGQVYLGFGLLGHQLTISEAFRLTLPSWVVLVALVPVVVWVADRATAIPSAGARASAHVSGALAFAGVHLAGSAALGEVVLTPSPGFARHFFQLASVYFVADLLTYGALVGLRGELRRIRSEGARALAAARVDADQATAEANVLRAHLNPDFLFNTLNAVAGLVARGETRSALDALAWLGRLVRTSTSRSRRVDHSLGGEIDRVDGYLRIQETRFEARFQANIDIPESAYLWPCPPLALYEGVVMLSEAGLARGDAVEVLMSSNSSASVRLSAVYRNGPPPRLDATPAQRVVDRLRERIGGEVSLHGSQEHGALRVDIGVDLHPVGV